MRIIARLADGSVLGAWDNATVLRWPEYPNWVDVIHETERTAEGHEKILAMLPTGTAIFIERP